MFWIVDNGSSHRGQAAVRRLTETYPRLVPVHLPIHASWLNQVEICFSIPERKVLTPAESPESASPGSSDAWLSEGAARCRRRHESITEYPRYSTSRGTRSHVDVPPDTLISCSRRCSRS